MNDSHFPSERKLVYVVVFLIFVFMLYRDNEQRYFSLFAKNVSLPIDSKQLESCDIIFRRGLSLVSNLVLTADNTSPYSHVGLIIKENGFPIVVHAVPDESENGIDEIRKESVAQFLRCDKATAYAVYRMKDKFNKSAIESYTDSIYSSRILFDDNFDLTDSEKLYCTEFIYKSYLESGISLTENKFDTLFIPLGKNPFILPGRILTSSYLHKILEYTQN